MRLGPNTGTLLVAIAGPIFSLLIGLLAALVVRFLPPVLFTPPFLIRLPQFLLVFASVNVCLTLFNIIPLYPLDGYEILYALLPSTQAAQFSKSAPYGPLLILALFFLLPFLAQFSGLSGFFLFQLPFYIWQGSLFILSLVAGNINFLLALYLYNIPGLH